MAYMSQENKAKLAPAIKAILKKYGVKGGLSVRNHSTLVLNIKQGPIDFVENFIETDKKKPYAKYMSDDHVAYVRKNQSIDVNPYWFQDHFTGVAKKFLTEIFKAMNNGNYDHSDAQIDYYCVGWYVDVKIGRWNQPYTVV
jgi:hypothetical protein